MKIGLCTALTVAFVVLKLTNVINWSWIWVFSPMWIPIVLVLAIVFLLVVLAHFIPRNVRASIRAWARKG